MQINRFTPLLFCVDAKQVQPENFSVTILPTADGVANHPDVLPTTLPAACFCADAQININKSC
jgi:hypothetical protein